MARTRSGQVAVVTGASSGLGRELARQLAADGARVALVARRAEPLAALQKLITDAGGTAAPFVCDVGSRESVEALVRAVTEQLGPIDLVIANAGVGRPTHLDPVNMADVEDTFRINLMGVVYTLSAALPGMLARKSGHLVAISSLASYRGLPGESAYCASKAAVNVYLDGLRAHLHGTGVKVTTVCPGFVTTPMTEMNTFHMPQVMTAEVAAGKILRALRRGVKVYNFPWRLTMMVKLSRWAPDWLMKRFMADYETPAPAKPPVP